jgi:SWI/SNF-related matrix-associated actin-dependent regulator 1 of chromatin subfamily A
MEWLKDMDKDKFVTLLDDDEKVVGALMHLYDSQTQEEQTVGYTGHNNGVGFNMMDAPFMTSIAKFYMNNGFITEKQVLAARKVVKKYSRQFAFGVPSKKNQRPKRKKASTACSARVVDTSIKIRIPYNQKLIEEIKRIPGKRAQKDQRGWFWTVPLNITNCEKVVDLGITPSESLKEWYETKTVKFEVDPNFKVDGLNGIPYPFQNEGIQFIDVKGGKALIADDMGLGKTIQAIGYLQLHREESIPAVIIVPASVKINWKREIEKWMTNPKVAILSGRPSESTEIPKAEIYVINYDILANQDETTTVIKYGIENKVKREKRFTGWADHLLKINPTTIICDECHYLKNTQAKRTKAVKKLTSKVKNCIMLSGTAIENRPIEIWQAINLIDPTLFPSYASFGKRYCDGKHNGYGWDYSGSSNEAELHKRLTESIMIRRLKKDVLKDLPQKQRSIIPMEIDNFPQYKKCQDDVIAYIRDHSGSKAAMKAAGAEALVKFEKLKQLAVKGKIKMAVQWVEDYIQDEKLVVFCTHKEVIETLREKFKDVCVHIDGSVSQINRQKAVDRFQNDDDCKLFIGNIKAAGVGITLTSASSTAFLELAWTPGAHDQAEDRVNRIGQKASSINAYYLLADNTIETEIAGLLDSKRKTIDAVLDGRETEDSDLLIELMKKYGGK